MEEVLDKMGSALITQDPKPPKSDFDLLYKNWGKLGNQEERRRELLENQKNNRNNKLDTFRGIIELVNIVEDTDVFKRDYHKKVHYRPSIYVAGFNKTSLSYNNVLMMSEWIVEKPEDFRENWYVSPCPKGVRLLVVANGGRTKCFTKYGQFRFDTNTLLPGGNKSDSIRVKTNSYCVLDCFYQDQNNTMYVIDFLAWNNQPMTDCDTEFRNYWLQSQFADRPEFGVISKRNKVKLVLLPKVPCTTEKFNEFMMTWPPFENGFPPLDGLLFYHKKAHYTSGQTPLVGWLYPYMVEEVLGYDINVHERYMAEKPKDYINQQTFIKQFEQRMARNAERRNRHSSAKNNSMDTSEAPKEEAQTEASTETMESEEASQVSQKTNGGPAKEIMESSDEPESSIKPDNAVDISEEIEERILEVISDN